MYKRQHVLYVNMEKSPEHKLCALCWRLNVLYCCTFKRKAFCFHTFVFCIINKLFVCYRNEERVSRSDHVQPRGKKLHLKSVTAGDNGVYRCTASNEAGSVDSSSSFVLAIPGKYKHDLFLNTIQKRTFKID